MAFFEVERVKFEYVKKWKGSALPFLDDLLSE
jgi:hypothetical protein